MKSKEPSVFLQRQIEVRLLKPVIERLSAEFGKDEVLNNIRTTIEKIAFESGGKLKESTSGNILSVLADYWQKLAEGDSLVMEDFLLSDSRLSFKITHCKYADYYKLLKAEELGEVFSCCRDKAFIMGFSNNIKMSRSKTIMEGNSGCNFTYELR
jgi:hypothetical protein